jgi:nicotinic acid mononucleotide adenylyltransferase/shikimate kinase
MEKKSKKDEKLNNNRIEVNPTLKEASSKKVVISWGRMNPPTIGHEKLVKRVQDTARKIGAKAEIYLSQSQDAKKNPLSYSDKVTIAKEAFGNIIQSSPAKTIIDLMKQLQSKYDEVTLVVGQDRVQEFETLLNKYNGKDYTMKSIVVVSAGERDPDADGVEGMSASKMRDAASKGEEEKFKSGLPKKLQSHAQDIYDMVRAGMKLTEDTELDEYVLSYAQRRRRALVMRKYERKMEAARERLKNRIASNQKLAVRARKKAIELIRKRVAGERGANYADLSPSEKIMIDQKVEKRKGAIAKIAARLLPKVRKAELQRVASLHQQKEDLDQVFESYYAGLSKSTAAKRKAHFDKHGEMDDNNPAAYKPAPGDATAKTKPSVHTRRYHMMYNGDGSLKYDRRFRAFRHIVRQEEIEVENDADLLEMIMIAEEISDSIDLDEAKAMEGLKNKAEKSGIPYGTLKSVYDRGVAAWRTGHRPGTTPQQWGYARVNSFITGGKTRTTADADLAKKMNESFEVFLDEGVNDPSIFKAVFLAGGPGSGKSFIVGKTALTALGFKVINSDDVFERALAKAGLKTTPEDIYSEKGQEIRSAAKAITGKKMDLALAGRLGLVIDGTGKDYEKIEKQASKLKKLGYEVAMIFVNTDLDTAKARNAARSRSLPDTEVESMWNGVQKNIGKFQNFFGTKMFVIDNSEGSNFEGAVTSTYRKISGWAKVTPTNPEAKSWIASARTVKEDKMSVKHHLGVGVPFKHQYKDNIKHIDTDLDGDVDEFDFKYAAPDETIGDPADTKKLLKKYSGEKKHTRKGVAFEQAVPTPVIPPESNDGEGDHAEKHIEAALTRAKKMKHFRTYKEQFGGGFENTDTLVQNYKAATPGEKGSVKKPKIGDWSPLMKNVKEETEETSESAGLWHNIRQRRAKGLPKLKPGDKNYPKSLNIDEAFESMMEAEEVEITASKMKDFEKFVDRMFEKFKIDFEFTKHFGDRMNDDRNSPKIKLKELADLIKKIYAKNGNPLKGKPGAELVVKDLQSDLNMPIVVKYDEKNDEIDIVAKTIMRKKNFSTPNPVIKY